MERSLSSMTYAVGLTIVAAPMTFLMMFFYAAIISDLPRPMQGESVKLPWAVCLAGFLIVPALGPWLISLLFVRKTALRITFFVALCSFVLLWYLGFEMGPLLSKAWRRGL